MFPLRYIFISGITLLLAGAMIYRKGRWPRRTGDAPHCRKCDYNLTGLSAGKCPECGCDFTEQTTNRGSRIRSRRAVYSGMLVFLIGVFIASHAVRQKARTVEWYHHRPFAWVAKDLANAKDSATANRAYGEIIRREDAAKLSKEQLAELIDAEIKYWDRRSDITLEPNDKDGRTADDLSRRLSTGSMTTKQQQELLNIAIRTQPLNFEDRKSRFLLPMLEYAYDNGQLNADQEKSFFRNMAGAHFSMRRVFNPGRPIRFQLNNWGRAASTRWRRDSSADILLDGKPFGKKWDEIDNSLHGGSGYSAGVPGEAPKPGHHVLKAHLIETIYELNPTNPTIHKSEHHIEFDAVAEFEVLDKEQPIKLISNPSVDEMKKFVVVEFEKQVSTPGSERYICKISYKRKLSVSRVFECFVCIDGIDYTIGTAKATARSDYQAIYFPLPTVKIPSKVMIRLKSSPKAAENTDDIYEIWDGELIFNDIPVK